MKTKIADKPTTELMELESQLYAEIMAIPDEADIADAMLAAWLTAHLMVVRLTLKSRVEAA